MDVLTGGWNASALRRDIAVAEDEGARAWRIGRAHECPYPSTDPRAMAWSRGWREAEHQYRLGQAT